MKPRKTIAALFLLPFAAFLHAGVCMGQDDSVSEVPYDDALDEELEWLKAETYVITASRVMEEVEKSAASITVITDRQLQQMGAVDLLDALVRVVPGIEYWTSVEDIQLISIYGQVPHAGILFLINNHPVNDAQTGASYNFNDMMVDNIKRIEFIRSPGSALYGANAFYGVINVITKSAEDVNGIEMSARGGSWDTQQYNLLGGKRVGEVEVAGNLNYYKTHGFSGIIMEDVQTQLDRLYSAGGVPYHVSLAPGYTNGGQEKYDAALNLKLRDFTLDGKYLDKEWNTPVSPFGALVDESVLTQKDYYVALGYATSFREVLDLNIRAYWNHKRGTYDGQWYPPGFAALTPDGFAIWQDGLIRFATVESERIGTDIQMTIQAGAVHTVVSGATYEAQEAVHRFQRANFLLTPSPDILIYLPTVEKTPDYMSMGTKTGRFHAVFLQDLWDITPALRLTTGVRYDRYRQFGSHVSPRIGLTWEYRQGYDIKVLYGHAFRAPTLDELYNSGLGNPDLDPETIDTYQMSLGGQITSSLNGRITFSRSEIKDVISAGGAQPRIFRNGGSTKCRSVETEMRFDFGRGTYLAGNLTYLDHETGVGENYYIGKIWTNIRLSRHLSAYADGFFVHGLHNRFTGDTKDAYPDHELVNITLIAKKSVKGGQSLELRSAVYNLFDENWAGYQLADVPFDLPMPGRNYSMELKFAF